MSAPTPTPDASQWNIGGFGSSGVGHVYFMYISCIFHVYFMYISCIFHVVCALFSALATRELANAKAVSSGIWALVLFHNSVLALILPVICRSAGDV